MRIFGRVWSRLLPDLSPQQERQRVERTLLGGRQTLTREDVARRSGVDPEYSRRLWRAMGFPDTPDGKAYYTEQDVAALGRARALSDHYLVGEDVTVDVARAMGQALGRLAQAQLEALIDVAGDDEQDTLRQAEKVQQAFGAIPDLVPDLEALVTYAWRRHLAAAVDRVFEDPGDDTGTRRLAVGFADLVGYTSLSQEMDPRTLGRLIDRFEASFLDIVAAGRGRVVKTVGDEVLWVTEDPACAAQIALELVETAEADRDLPSVRAGAALGPVVLRHGDVFGPVVNVASRLTEVARPSTVLVDASLAEALAGSNGLQLEAARRVRLRGYGRVTSYALQRAAASGRAS